jgi:hypothetical protein
MRNRLVLLASVILLQSVSAFSKQPVNRFFETHVIFQADARFSSHAYPTIAALPDKRLLMTWTVSENEKPKIVGSFSRDEGNTWDNPQVLINTPGFGDYDPNIIVTRNEIQVYSTSTPIPQELISYSETWKSTCKFNSSRWTRPERMPQLRKYLVGKIHVGLTLRDGTLVMPYSWDIPAEMDHPVTAEGKMNLKSGALLSRDDGRTWTPSEDIYTQPPQTSSFSTLGVDEPGMVLLKNGEVYALLRTGDVWLYESRSGDGARTWSVPKPSPLRSHNAPAALWRLNGLPDVVVVWNNSPRNRWPLEVALSRDNARTWSKPKTLANPVGFQASYPSITQARTGIIIAVWQQDRSDKKGRDLHIARFNRAWLLSRSRLPKGNTLHGPETAG